VKEFDAILKPNGTIIYLGTPQTEMTLYRELESRGYVTTIWPARYPKDLKDRESYGHRLAPMLAGELDADPRLYWEPTDPIRFDDTDLRERELSYGKGGFALQFMLNPNLSDAEKYPLKLRDFIVGRFSMENAPTTLQWLTAASNNPSRWNWWPPPSTKSPTAYRTWPRTPNTPPAKCATPRPRRSKAR
jgi:hypothetical protein